MCHPLPLTGIDITFSLSDEPCMVEIRATVTCTGWELPAASLPP